MRSSFGVPRIFQPRLFLVAAVWLACLAGPVRPASGQTCTSFVNATDGDDSNPGSQILPWRSVEFAFGAAENGETVCISAGEYFYGADADGIEFAEDGKSVDFVIRAFAGETEVRLSERYLRLDTGDGVVRFLAGTADGLTLGRGVVNTDDPSEPGLLNFMHSMELVSGTIDARDISLTLEESVGNPDYVNPDNGSKSAPESAAVRIENGRVLGEAVWESASRTYIYTVTGPGSGVPLALPADLSGSVLSFVQSGVVEFPFEIDARGAELRFGQSGAVVFASDVHLDAATSDLVWTGEATGSVSFNADLRVSSTVPAGGELAFSGTGDIHVERLLAVSALSGPHSARIVHDSSGFLRLERFESAVGAGNGPFELALAHLAGTAEMGIAGTTLSPPGPIENSSGLSLAGDLSLSSAGPATLLNSGQIDLGASDLILGQSGVSVLNSGTMTSGSVSPGQVRVLADASVAGGGTLSGLEITGGTLLLDTQTVAGRLSVTDAGRIRLADNGELSVSGDISLTSDPSFASVTGTLVMTGTDQELSIPSGNVFPEFRISGGNVTLAPGSTALPGITLQSGSLTADVDGSLNVAGLLRVADGSANLTASGPISMAMGASLGSGTLQIDSPEPVIWAGTMDSGSGTIVFDAPSLRPAFGSTVDFRGANPIVLPALLPGESGAEIRVATLLDIESDLLLSSGVVLFEEGGSMAVSGNLTRTSGRFEPEPGSFLELDGTSEQVISGFSGSVLPSLRLSGSAVSIPEPLTVLGDVEVTGGSTYVVNAVQLNLSGVFSQSDGVFSLGNGSSLFAAGGLSISSGSFESGVGSIRSSGDVVLASPEISAGDTELILDGSGERSVVVGTDIHLRSLVVRTAAVALMDGPGSMTLGGGLGVRTGAGLDLGESVEILMTGANPAPVITNSGRIGGPGFIRMTGPAGADPFVLSGDGVYGAISVELADDDATADLANMDTLRVSGSIRFISGGIDAAGRRVELVTSTSTPGIILNLENSTGGAGLQDGRGFLDSTGPLDIGTDGGSYDLSYIGSLTSPYTASGEYIQGRVRNLSIGSPDAVNTPPVFGVSLGGSVRIPGELTVASSSLFRLTDGPLALSGESAAHRVDGRIVGGFDTTLEGAGATLLSTDSTAHIGSLVVNSPSDGAAVQISGLPAAERLRVDAGEASIIGSRPLRLGASMTLAAGRLTLGTGIYIGSGASEGILDVRDGDLVLDSGSFLEFPSGAEIVVDQNAAINLTTSARSMQDERTGFMILGDESSIRGPSGIPRLSLDPVPGTAESDDVFLSGDLEITDAFLHRNGDLFLGAHVLRLSGGFVDYDRDASPFDGQRDEIAGDVAGGGGVVEVTGGVDFRLGSDMLLQGATMIIDAPGDLVRLVSTSSEPRQLQVAALPLELIAGTIDLGMNDLRVTGSSTNLLYLGEIAVIGSTVGMSQLPVHPVVRRDGGSFPLRDRDFGEIVVDGSGNASVAVTRPVTIPSLRVDGTVRLPVANEPLTVSRRLVFGRNGATILAESAGDLRLLGGASLVRRGEGTLASVPVFAGPVDVFYDLDDGDLTGTDTGFQGTLATGLELPAAVRRLGVFAGGRPNGSENRVILSSDVTVGRLLAVFGGVFDRSDRSVTLSNDALFAIDQIDINFPARIEGGIDWSGSGEIDVLLGAAMERIDPDASLLPAGVTVDSLTVSLGRTGGPAITVRQRIPIVVNDLVVEAPGARGTYRFDGMDVTAVRSVRIENAAMLTSDVASVESGSGLTIGPGAELSGSVSARVGGDFVLGGHFGGLSLDLSGGFVQSGTVSGATRLRFSGTDQTWSIPESVQTGVLELDMIPPPTGPPVLRIASTSGAVGRTVTVNGLLHLESGLLDTGDQRVRLGGPDGGFIRNPEAGLNDAPPSHIAGTVVRLAPAESTEPFVFPTGDETDFRPLTLAFPSPLLSATDLGVRYESLPYASRSGLPVMSPDGVLIRDAAGFAWRVTSSVNFAQSQPVTVTAMIDEAVSGDPEQHRLLRRAGGNLSAPWTAVGGSPVVSLVEGGIQVRSVGAAGLLTPDGITLGIGVPDLLYAGQAQLQVINMAPGPPRDVILANERIIRSLSPGAAGGTITLGLDEPGPVPIDLSVRDASNSTVRTLVETTLRPNRVTVIGLTAAEQGQIDAHVFHSDRTMVPPPEMARLEFMHLDPSKGGLRIARGHPASTPVFMAEAVGSWDGPVPLPADPLVLIPVPAEEGAFSVEDFRVDLTPFGGRNALLVAADAALFGASIDSPFLAVVADDGTVSAGLVVTGISTSGDELPSSFRLGGNYPNPLSGRTTLTFDLPEPADVRLIVVDMLGRVVRRLDAGRFDAGTNRELDFDANGLAGGVYVYRLEADSDAARHADSGTMVVIR